MRESTLATMIGTYCSADVCAGRFAEDEELDKEEKDECESQLTEEEAGRESICSGRRATGLLSSCSL